MRKPFNKIKIVEQAMAGELTKVQIRAGIKRAQSLGFDDVAKKLADHLFQTKEFFDDGVSNEVKDRVAKGISKLKSMGIHPRRTEQMLARYGVRRTIGRIVLNAEVGKNFLALKDAGHLELTAEATVVDFYQHFHSEAVEAAKKKLSGLSW